MFTDMLLACATCPRTPTLTINGRAFCRECAHAAIDRASPPPRVVKDRPLYPGETEDSRRARRHAIGAEVLAEIRAEKARRAAAAVASASTAAASSFA